MSHVGVKLQIAILVLLFPLLLSQIVRDDVPIWPYPLNYQDDTLSAKRTLLCMNDASSLDVVFVNAPSSLTDMQQKNFALVNRAIKRALSSDFFVETEYEKANIQLVSGRFGAREDSITPEILKNAIYLNDQRVKFYINVSDFDADLVLGVDESYSLSIKAGEIRIEAKTVWGFLRGLQSLNQIIEYNFDRENAKTNRCNYYIKNLPITIQDAPRFPWRGFMLDLSRHYMPLDVIRKYIEALSIEKMNVLHLHLTDAQSFPIIIDKYPELAYKGAYAPHLVYTKQDLKDLVAFARDYGIRLIPEIDVPGHAYSWGYAYPNLTITCPARFDGNENNRPLDPTNEFTYEVISAVLDFINEVFPDNYIHLGGDELNFKCWELSPIVQQFIQQHPELQIQTMHDMWAYFQSRVKTIYESKRAQYQLVAWQELLLNLNSTLYTVPSNAIITAWSEVTDLSKVAASGLRSLLSAGFYLDRQNPTNAPPRWLYFDTWVDMYKVEPWNLIAPSDRFVGLEGCQWGEQVDPLALDSRVYPRLSAVSERAWSPDYVNNTSLAMTRLIKHRCFHLVRQGIQATPIRPDYCPYSYAVPLDIPYDENALLNVTTAILIISLIVCIFLFVGIVVAVAIAVRYFFQYKRMKAMYVDENTQGLLSKQHPMSY